MRRWWWGRSGRWQRERGDTGRRRMLTIYGTAGRNPPTATLKKSSTFVGTQMLVLWVSFVHSLVHSGVPVCSSVCSPQVFPVRFFGYGGFGFSFPLFSGLLFTQVFLLVIRFHSLHTWFEVLFSLHSASDCFQFPTFSMWCGQTSKRRVMSYRTPLM